jgi:2-methylcitrate dehydratase PrpD
MGADSKTRFDGTDGDGAARPVERLAAFVSALSYGDLSAEDVRSTERAFIDTFGVVVSGMEEESTKTAIEALAEPGAVPLWGTDRETTTAAAALVGGVAGHSQDYDDVSWGMSGHPSVTMLPAILALAEGGDVDGRRAIEAYVAGLEAQCFLSAAINPGHYRTGWHSTATLGTFGAAAAAAKALGLEPEATRNALGIAASRAAGLKSNFGTMTKPLHAGAAARAGVTAARLAAGGFTASPDAVDGEGSFLDLYAGEEGVALSELPDLGEPTALAEHGINVKKYPCCYYTHTSIYAAERLAAENGVDPADVESIRVVTSPGPADALHYPDPDTGLEGKFSLEYTVACAVAREHVGVEAFEDDALADPDVQAVRERVEWEIDDSLEYNDTTVEMRMETTEGVYTRTQDVPPGTPANPLSEEELESKFRRCAGRVLDEEAVDRTYERLDSLRSVEDVGAIGGGRR